MTTLEEQQAAELVAPQQHRGGDIAGELQPAADQRLDERHSNDLGQLDGEEEEEDDDDDDDDDDEDDENQDEEEEEEEEEEVDEEQDESDSMIEARKSPHDPIAIGRKQVSRLL